ncbi:MAG: heme peroxidase [Nocardioidaceae bacterium]|nr:heme peroxidase [Nocardioidaceae bacterium]
MTTFGAGRTPARHKAEKGESERRRRRATAVVAVLLIVAGVLVQVVAPSASQAATAPVGQGFTVTKGDLAYILKQITISERHAATFTAEDPCKGLLAEPGDGIPDSEQVPDALTSYGLRTVDGSCNNLLPGRERFAASDQLFPRLTTPSFQAAEDSPPAFGPSHPTSYTSKSGLVFDSEPRVISNLVVDQTSSNPAAVAAAGHPVRTQGAEGSVPCDVQPDPVAGTPGSPEGCIPDHQSLPIPNVTTDAGLSPPFNGLFTLFGQFFDHGVDQTVKGGGTVFVPLKDDDPLIAGPDHKLGTSDDLRPDLRFMVLSRAANQPGKDGKLGTADDVQEAANTDTPWVDNSQTYASHASHQVFLREYQAVDGRPVDTGRLLTGPAGTPLAGGQARWVDVKKQAADLLGLKLEDKDVLNVPMLAVDPYGNFLPGPARGLPQYVTKTGLVEGDTANPVPVPSNVLTFDTPFLTDIAHNADPSPADADGDPRTPPVAPRPDDDTTASHDFASQPPGTYDDELLDSHFICGDGRCNENIGLTSIHQVFHSEHNRLVADMQNTLESDTSPAGVQALAAWQRTTGPAGWDYGQRLFQAARFVDEMEYQHTVFEEFARKVVPAIQPFHVYHADVNAAIPAEFAHAVYRFGHSMLTDTIDRRDAQGRNYNIPLLDGFLNPPEFNRDADGHVESSEKAAAGIMMGMSDQTGNEIDEFVVETLRNNLLGLPLDLAAINLTRGRSEGVLPLNQFRRQLFEKTHDAQLKPYTSWADYGQNLKHPETLVNLVAAYGTYPTVTAAKTVADKRAAAQLVVDPPSGVSPTADQVDFMNSTGAWADRPDGMSTTGLDDVDLWIGGLAENTQLFGGHLGSTFNYVFEKTLTDLQNGDRLYYLARTPGMNLRTALEGNSFGEMVMRNVDGADTLKADAFATADCKFQLSHLAGTPEGYAVDGPSVADDPATPDCDEHELLLRKPDGTIQYRARNSVDPPGINGQGVYNGTDGADKVVGGNDNDTVWGDGGDDVVDGYFGDDVVLGGAGDDRVTDAGGADVLRGGPGDDALDAGIGDDIVQGGDGKDLIDGGQNDNETFAGEGDDFIRAGEGADAVFGDGGDDWIEGGSGQDLLQGDHGAPFFDDPAEQRPGNDVFVGQVGENDYDAEGGDDIMSQNAAIDRNAGAGGFDWAIHQYDTVGADDDMEINNNLGPLPIQVVVNRDRWQEVEGNSGSPFDDVIKGTNDVPAELGGAGFTGCDVLDQAGVNRIKGLGELVPPLTGDLSAVEALSAAGACPLEGGVWGAGNILLGGGGNDTITGRGGDDIIDGDRELRVRISVRTDPADPSTEIGSTDALEHAYLPDDPTTLESAIFDGKVSPRQLVAVREIVDSGNSGDVDTAVFSGPRSSYDISTKGDTVTVAQTGQNLVGQKVSDGTDTLRNVERLQFSDQTLTASTPDRPTFTAGPVAGNGTVTLSFSAAADGLPPTTGIDVEARVGGTVEQVISLDGAATTRTLTTLTNGRTYTFRVRERNLFGAGEWSDESDPVTVNGTMTAPTDVVAIAGNAYAQVSWTPGEAGGFKQTGWRIDVRTHAGLVRTVDVHDPATTEYFVTGLRNGTRYTFVVHPLTAAGAGPASDACESVLPQGPPGAPVMRSSLRGATGGPLTLTARWSVPNAGGSPVLRQRLTVTRLAATGYRAVGTSTVSLGGSARSRTLRLTAGRYRFTVTVVTTFGTATSGWSTVSRPR